MRLARRRGQPLVVLVGIMLCWIGARAAVWLADPHESAGPPLVAAGGGAGLPVPGNSAPQLRLADGTPVPFRARTLHTAGLRGEGLAHRSYRHGLPPVQPQPSPAQAMRPMETNLAFGQVARTTAQAPAQPFLPAVPIVSPNRSPERRWSADAWTLLRSGGGVVGAGPSKATYGASQLGAVVRYRLLTGNPHRPTAYFRASAALNGSGEREAALGLSVRPIAAVPVVLAGEGRVSRLSGRTVLRPAAMAITELAPIALPAGGRAEIYLQGGYVGGVGATPFVDGQLRIDKRVGHVGPVEIRGGAGVWGGAQEGASRLDAGPSLTLGITQGPLAARIGLDWRFRLKGSAEPASGPALTISAGF